MKYEFYKWTLFLVMSSSICVAVTTLQNIIVSVNKPDLGLKMAATEKSQKLQCDPDREQLPTSSCLSLKSNQSMNSMPTFAKEDAARYIRFYLAIFQ